LNNQNNKNGFALITVLMLTSIILFLGISFTAAIINEGKIAKSQIQSVKAHYLSEAGIQEALWKIQNDSVWKNNFETDANWHDEIYREDVFAQGSSFRVKIKNLEFANAEIISTGFKVINGNSKARRSSKLDVIKTVEPQLSDDETIIPIEEEGGGGQDDTSIYPQLDGTVLIASGNINVWGINLNSQGSVFSKKDFDVTLWSGLNIQGYVKSCENVNVDATSVLNTQGIYSQNNPPASDPMDIPAVGFDSEGDSASLKAEAQSVGQVFTSEEFSNLLRENSERNFNKAVYVTGNIILQKGANLTINGALASDGSITIGDDWQWWDPCGSNDAKISITAPAESPSGIFAKNRIIVKTCVGDINIKGVLYAGNSISFSSISNNFSVTGSVISKDIEGTGIWKPITLIFDEEISKNSLRAAGPLAPIIDSSYWED